MIESWVIEVSYIEECILVIKIFSFVLNMEIVIIFWGKNYIRVKVFFIG